MSVEAKYGPNNNRTSPIFRAGEARFKDDAGSLKDDLEAGTLSAANKKLPSWTDDSVAASVATSKELALFDQLSDDDKALIQKTVLGAIKSNTEFPIWCMLEDLSAVERIKIELDESGSHPVIVILDATND